LIPKRITNNNRGVKAKVRLIGWVDFIQRIYKFLRYYNIN
jgi:hypothetical protein